MKRISARQWYVFHSSINKSSIEQYLTEDTVERFMLKVYRRHDQDKDSFLNFHEFSNLIKNFGDESLTTDDIQSIYNDIKESEQGIDYEAFKKNASPI